MCWYARTGSFLTYQHSLPQIQQQRQQDEVVQSHLMVLKCIRNILPCTYHIFIMPNHFLKHTRVTFSFLRFWAPDTKQTKYHFCELQRKFTSFLFFNVLIRTDDCLNTKMDFYLKFIFYICTLPSLSAFSNNLAMDNEKKTKRAFSKPDSQALFFACFQLRPLKENYYIWIYSMGVPDSRTIFVWQSGKCLSYTLKFTAMNIILNMKKLWNCNTSQVAFVFF